MLVLAQENTRAHEVQGPRQPLALTGPVCWQADRTAQPDGHEPHRRLDTESFPPPLPKAAPSSQELCSAPSCRKEQAP